MVGLMRERWALSDEATKAGRKVGVHVKVDTGMSRVGVEPDEALAFCGRVRELPNLYLAGVLTHFASADEPDPAPTREQWARFQPLVDERRRMEPRPVLHAANSAGAIRFPETALDWVRGGLVTYGEEPGPDPNPFAVEPVASMPPDDVVAIYAPTIQRYLTDPLP